MLNVIPLDDGNDLARWKEIAESKNGKRRGRLLALEPKIKSRYEKYNSAVRELETVDATTLTEGESLDSLHCFKNETAALAKVLERIESKQRAEIRGRCAYCGWEADSFDHYVPESAFPEFCVLAKNLIPCCSACNRLKSARWVHGGQRLVLNLYYDELPAARAIRVDVLVKGPKSVRVTFQPTRYAGVDTKYWEAWERTWEYLHLARRFAKRSNGIIAEIRSELAASTRKDLKSARRILQIQAQRKAAIFGIHYWEAVLIEGLAASDDFLQLCIEYSEP